MTAAAGNAVPQSAVTPVRTLTGRVVGDGMDKTITVQIDRSTRHPLYGKYIRRSTRLLVHDEENSCKVGDVVRICSSRPLSKRKAWRLHDIVTRAGGRQGGEQP